MIIHTFLYFILWLCFTLQIVYNEILKFVRTQWQLSDLREINNDKGCLPKNLKQQRSTMLYGTYILQVYQ